MGLYGTQTTYPASLNIDKIYENKKTMDENAAIDGIFPGRYVLVSYTGGAEAFEPKIKTQLLTCVNYSDEGVWGFDEGALVLDWLGAKEIPLTANQKVYLTNLCKDWNNLKISQTSKDSSTYDGILYKKMLDDEGNMSYAAVANLTAAFNTIYQSGVGAIKTGESGEVFNATAFNTATAANSHAEGYSTKASGPRAHAEGTVTHASAGSSHAEGQATLASGWCSHSEGYASQAKANFAHAEGRQTLVEDVAGHAEGVQTKAKGHAGHAEGVQTKTGRDTRKGFMVVQQTSTTSSLQLANVEGLQEGDFFSLCTIGGIYYDVAKINTINQESDNLYTLIFDAIPSDCVNWIAQGGATLFVQNKPGVGNVSFYKPFSHAEGQRSRANGFIAHAEGTDTLVGGDYGHAEGYATRAGANPIVRITGSNYGECIANGKNNLVVGEKVSIRDKENGSFKMTDVPAKGVNYNSTNDQSAVYFEKGSGQENVEIDDLVIFKNKYADQEIPLNAGAHAEGCLTAAQGTASHSEGAKSFANADYSHAEGLETIAEGTASHASGIGTVASREASTAIGKYNAYDDSTIFAVGIGSDDTNRKNALEVKEFVINEKNGETSTYVNIGSTGPDDNSVVTKSYVAAKMKGVEAVNVIEENNTNPITSQAVYKEFSARPEKSYDGLTSIPKYKLTYGSDYERQPAAELEWGRLVAHMDNNYVLNFTPLTTIVYPKLVKQTTSAAETIYTPKDEYDKQWTNYQDSPSYECLKSIYIKYKGVDEATYDEVLADFYTNYEEYKCSTAPAAGVNKAQLYYYTWLPSSLRDPKILTPSFPLQGLEGALIKVNKRSNERISFLFEQSTVKDEKNYVRIYEAFITNIAKQTYWSGWQKIFEDEEGKPAQTITIPKIQEE